MGRRQVVVAALAAVAVLLGAAVVALLLRDDDRPERPETRGAAAGAAPTRSHSPTAAPSASPDAPAPSPTASPTATPTATPTVLPPQVNLAERAPGPVVVVPGYGGETALLRPLVRALEGAGREVHLVTGLGSATTRIQTQAKITGRRIDRLLDAGAPSVDLIGFSQGGLVVRAWVEKHPDEPVRRVVTLGTPHHGSQVAALAEQFLPRDCSAACHQLVPGSPFLHALDPSAPGPNWTSLWTTDDQVSTPPRTAVLPGALNRAVQEVCPGARVAHGMLPRTPFVVDLVVTALEAPAPLAEPDQLTATRCPG